MEKKSTKKNSKQNIRFLFLGTLIPLLIVTFLSEFVIGFVSLKLTKLYSQEKVSNVISELNNEIADHILPIMINLDDFVSFAENTQYSEYASDIRSYPSHAGLRLTSLSSDTEVAIIPLRISRPEERISLLRIIHMPWMRRLWTEQDLL